jgi:hypothetical protein
METLPGFDYGEYSGGGSGARSTGGNQAGGVVAVTGFQDFMPAAPKGDIDLAACGIAKAMP